MSVFWCQFKLCSTYFDPAHTTRLSCCHPQARRSSSPIWTRRTGLIALRMYLPTSRNSTAWAKRWDQAKTRWDKKKIIAFLPIFLRWCDVAGGRQSHGAAGIRGEDQGEDLRQAEDLFCRSGNVFFWNVLAPKVTSALYALHISVVCVRGKWQLLISPLGPVQRCEGLGPEGHGLSDFGAQCWGADPHPELQTARYRWGLRCLHCKDMFCVLHNPLDLPYFSQYLGGGGYVVCIRVWLTSAFRAEGSQQLHDDRGNDVGDPGTESRVHGVQSTSGEDKVGHKSRNTWGEGEGWPFICFQKHLWHLVTFYCC